MSAINWLSDSVTIPAAVPASPAWPNEPAVTGSASVGDITMLPLDAPRPDAVGLLPVSVTGLPQNLWGATGTNRLAQLIRDTSSPGLPALQDLLFTLLLAELDPPQDAGGGGVLLMARLDKLIDLGALDQAQALIDLVDPKTPELFRLWFDVSLLTGTEDRACAALGVTPDIAPTFSARIFCLARNGDWSAAALTLHTAQALGYLTDFEDQLLSRFLDPELADTEPPLTPPPLPSPLVFRMFEAIGEPLSTVDLPLAFAQADLRDTAGWKSQLEAAERLGRSGALSENRIQALYTDRLPAASGGIWDRVDAFQAFDMALTASDPSAVDKTLRPAFDAAKSAGLEVPFARLYATALSRLPLTGASAALAFRVALLSNTYEEATAGYTPDTPIDVFLKTLAAGTPSASPAGDALASAIAESFAATSPPATYARMLSGDQLGEAILMAIQRLTRGASGQMRDITEALSLLRAVGLEDVARRTALDLMLLERRL
ncbi:hypothetical protein [Pseudogemmobacter sp. W21_MBD1_M6]|uniref:hypothetical protein n=1 Tax=Pseudogemmobacter sp. W21_MBD1_M6 TaxID=3240271 RepID=UPI003F95A6FD